MTKNNQPKNPREVLDELGAKWSPDLDAYLGGETDASKIRCTLCLEAPCACPEFGSDAYFALINRRHGRRS
ncbi:hypothetical protein [Nonomuraea rubra]|uniref:Uncharacterized protein n=1 Tax=Nonomuraea rubra TaxID=46180 RepID=A0A7X0P6E1_9ACTN|nr:hypothetical protein [Nonomuraea rubra]MBB6556106.1 hypothetical protein [Nonomuraea rubra]